jgi:membrane-associated phospholipid phosphatase
LSKKIKIKYFCNQKVLMIDEMKPNRGKTELGDREYAAGALVQRRGCQLIVIDHYFRGVIQKTDNNVTDMIQWPCQFNGFIGKIVQHVIFIVTLGITWTFAVEWTPGIIYYAYIYDSSWKAKWLILNFALLNFLTQLPKRVFWRNRPWRINVGKVFKRDKTSSFPSRTTNLATVFAFTIFVSDLGNIEWPWLVRLSFVCNYIAAVSRIYIGAHFFSDCVVGILFAWVLNFSNLVGWWALADINARGWLNLLWANWEVSRYAVMVAMFGFQIWMNRPAVNFWDKGNSIFGCIWGVAIGVWDMEHKLGRVGKFTRSGWWTADDLGAFVMIGAYITVVNMIQPNLEQNYPKFVQTVRMCVFIVGFKMCQYFVMNIL